jgi:acylphosphatase
MKEALKLHPDFRDLICAFIEGNAEFVVVGAYALGIHGVVRNTGDLDIFFRPTKENAKSIIKSLKSFGFQSKELTVESLLKPDTVHYFGRPPLRVDLLNSISGVSFEEAWNSRIGLEMDDFTIPVIGKEALLKNKAASGRPKDLVDVELLNKTDLEK